MSDLTTTLLFTDVVNGLLSKGWLMIEDNMEAEENCYLERNDRIVKVEVVNNAILVVGVDLKGDNDDSNGVEG